MKLGSSVFLRGKVPAQSGAEPQAGYRLVWYSRLVRRYTKSLLGAGKGDNLGIGNVSHSDPNSIIEGCTKNYSPDPDFFQSWGWIQQPFFK